MKLHRKKLKVGPYRYTILVSEKVDHDGCYARIDHMEFEIELSPRLADQKRFASLMHEGIHAIEVDRQLKIEEATVTSFANGLVALLRDNPWLKELI